MNRRHFLAAGGAALPALAAGAQAAGGVIDVGRRRELFVDRFLIDRLSGAELRLAQPYDAGPVLALDRPWEGRFCGYATVIHDGPRYHLYYRGVPNAGQDGRGDEVYCYA